MAEGCRLLAPCRGEPVAPVLQQLPGHQVAQQHPITGELVLLVGHFAKRLVVLNAAVGWDGSASVQLAGN